MLEWKRAESEDLIAERTRLKHGELSHQEGADDQVFQFLLMQAQQVRRFLEIMIILNFIYLSLILEKRNNHFNS